MQIKSGLAVSCAMPKINVDMLHFLSALLCDSCHKVQTKTLSLYFLFFYFNIFDSNIG